MKIALINSFPNKPNTAEREFIERFHIACGTINVDSLTVTTSDDIENARPDLVLATHEFSRKLTPFPTIGLVWSPLQFFDRDSYREKSLLSYDGFLCGSTAIRAYLEDIQGGIGISKPVSDDIFLPTTYKLPNRDVDRSTSTLCYVGVHWDGFRHKKLFDHLTEKQCITFYGPEESWAHYPNSYGGSLPFDGRSVPKAIGRHNIALCLHKPEHLIANTPSMRIFEALAIGANVICDKIEFAIENLSDFVYFVDAECEASTVAEQIRNVVEYIRSHPHEAADRADLGKQWFEAVWSLESKIEKTIVPLLRRVRERGQFNSLSADRTVDKSTVGIISRLYGGIGLAAPAVEVVVRTGGRPLEFLARAVASIKSASSPSLAIGVIVVDFAGREDILAFAAQSSTRECPVRYVRSAGTGFRSTALWDGLRSVRASFVAHLDDDDTVFPNHYRQLHRTLANAPQANVSFSGVVKVEDESGHYFNAPNFGGPLNNTIMERRELTFLEKFDLSRLARFDNYIQSNAWMARTTFVKSLLNSDPQLLVSEDVYLYLLMASRGPFVFTGSATAAWHWRSTSGENSMLSVDQNSWREAGQRVMRRLRHVPFVASLTYDQILEAPLHNEDLVLSDGGFLPQLRLGESVSGGKDLARNLVLKRFHPPEAEGIWTGVNVAEVHLNIANDVQASGGFLVVDFTAGIGPGGSNEIELEIAGGSKVKMEVFEWDAHRLVLPVQSGASGYLRVIISSAEICYARSDSAEKRDLAFYLRSMALTTQSDVAGY